MLRKPRNRRGFTLAELVVTMVLVTTVVAVGAVMLTNDEQDQVKDAAVDALALLRTARNVSTRQSVAVVVVVWRTGADPGGGGQTAGQMASYLAESSTCPDSSPIGSSGGTPYPGNDVPLDEITLIPHNGSAYEGPGISRLVPIDGPTATTLEMCFRPNGRVVNRTTGEPFAGAEAVDFSGNAEIWFQYGPLTDPGGTLAVPRAQIIIPYTGLVRMEQ